MVSKNSQITISRQCEILGVSRSSVYYKPVVPTADQIATATEICHRIDFWHTKFCYMGHRTIAKKLQREDGLKIGKKRVRRLMQDIGIYAVYPKPNLSRPRKDHKKFPYLLKNMGIFLPNQVWAVDITYIPMGKSHMYLTAIIDWHSRFIVGWALADTLEATHVVAAVKDAICTYGTPGIINSDQGSQFTSDEYIQLLADHGIRQSMDGKARWVDNVLIERWFRSLKCECIYIDEHASPKALKAGVAGYIFEYNNERPHQSLGYKYPCEIYAGHFTHSVA